MTDRNPSERADVELARILRQLRVDAGISQTAAAKLAGEGFSQSKVARLESGRLTPTPLDAGRLARRVGADRATLRDAIRLALDVRDERAGLSPVRVAFTRRPGLGQRQWRHREQDARTVCTFHSAVVPGLLQSEDYMRALYRSAVHGPRAADPDGEDEFVRERIQRQHARADLPAVQLVTEGALCNGSAGVDVMRAQCAHIAELTRTRPAWEIGVVARVLPDGAPATFPVGSFDLYDRSHVVIGTDEAGIARLTTPEVVAGYVALLDRLRAMAVYGAGARGALTRIAEDYERARTQ